MAPTITNNPLNLLKARRDKLKKDVIIAEKKNCVSKWFANIPLKNEKADSIDEVLKLDITKVKSHKELEEMLIKNGEDAKIAEKKVSRLIQGRWSKETANLLKNIYEMNSDLREIVPTEAGDIYQETHNIDLIIRDRKPESDDFNPYYHYYTLTYKASLCILRLSKVDAEATEAHFKVQNANLSYNNAYDAYSDEAPRLLLRSAQASLDDATLDFKSATYLLQNAENRLTEAEASYKFTVDERRIGLSTDNCVAQKTRDLANAQAHYNSIKNDYAAAQAVLNSAQVARNSFEIPVNTSDIAYSTALNDYHTVDLEYKGLEHEKKTIHDIAAAHENLTGAMTAAIADNRNGVKAEELVNALTKLKRALNAAPLTLIEELI